MSNNMALVAGVGEEGFRDGAFQAAFFNRPQGLAISSDGTRLFVADSANNRIRVIRLDQNNTVNTLVGLDSPGAKDGPLDSATFNNPTGVVYLPGDRLIVNDFGNNLLRLIDLKKGVVSILAGNTATPLPTITPSSPAEGPADKVSMSGIRDMVYLGSTDTLYFSQPSLRSLKMLEMKTGKVSDIPHDPDFLPHPAAICGIDKKIYVADRDLARVYQADCGPGERPSLSPFASTDNYVFSLATSGDGLYALQADTHVPLKRLLPQSEPVTFVSASGDVVPDPGNYLPTFLNLNPEDTIGFISDPIQERKFYFVNPRLNIVTSFRDRLVYEPMEERSNSKELYDYDYPTPKPPKTFRILLVGDSRSFRVTGHPYAISGPDYGYNHQASISKRLELELNTLAALEDAPMNFEIINMYHIAATSLYCWPAWQVPDAVKANDIDLVLIMQITEYRQVPAWDYVNYFFDWPLSPEGIPFDERTPGFAEYRLKPALERIPDGEPRKFYEMCEKRKLVTVGSDNNLKFDLSPTLLDKDSELHQAYIHMCGKPMDVLNRKLKAMRTSSGEPVRMLLFYTPTGVYKPFSDYPPFWRDVAQMYDIPFLNLYDEMTALRLSYYPISDLHMPEDHFVSEGHLFLSRLLAHDLIRDGYIPWSKPASHAKDALFP